MFQDPEILPPVAAAEGGQSGSNKTTVEIPSRPQPLMSLNLSRPDQPNPKPLLQIKLPSSYNNKRRQRKYPNQSYHQPQSTTPNTKAVPPQGNTVTNQSNSSIKFRDVRYFSSA